jgi:queuosine precursor transporter
MPYTLLYLASIVLINIGFICVPLIHGWPPMSLAVGLVFVLRDFAQREIGHKV